MGVTIQEVVERRLALLRKGWAIPAYVSLFQYPTGERFIMDTDGKWKPLKLQGNEQSETQARG